MRIFIIYIILLNSLLWLTLCKSNTLPTNNKNNKTNSEALIELGRYFFFDKRLSYDQGLSCSTCHNPNLAFTDGYEVAINSKAENLRRNTPTILNINNRTNFNWANSKITSLKVQIERPMFGQHPTEMDISGHEKEILSRFIKDAVYKKLYKEVFQASINQITIPQIIEAITTYELQLQSRNSRFDQFKKNGDSSLLTDFEWLGFKIFHADSIECNACHGGADFFEPDRGPEFANIGLYNCNQSYPPHDPGLQEEDGDQDNNGVFRIPTLRNIALTAPYYHDGSEESLIQVIKNYERGGRKIESGPCKGDGKDHPSKDGRLQVFHLTEYERAALIAFLQTLTDTSYLHKDLFVDPFKY